MFRSENEFVEWLRQRAPRAAGKVRLGIGDDAALIEVGLGQALILTTDMSLEGVHFTRKLHPARAIGHRALARSLSDVAAMGGSPRYALVSLAISKAVSRSWIEDVYAGIFGLAKRFGVKVIGGDTAVVRGRSLIDILVAGEVPRGKELLRSGAKAGDSVFVSGRLGLSALGLHLLKSGVRRGDPEEALAIQAHLYPQPQCKLGRFLCERGLASALMDISDGLSMDLARLCAASGVGARLFAERIPCPRLKDAAESLNLALHGGEDYQLLFTVPPREVVRTPSSFRGIPLHQIGEIQAKQGLFLVDERGDSKPLKPSGYDHFSKALKRSR